MNSPVFKDVPAISDLEHSVGKRRVIKRETISEPEGKRRVIKREPVGKRRVIKRGPAEQESESEEDYKEESEEESEDERDLDAELEKADNVEDTLHALLHIDGWDEDKEQDYEAVGDDMEEYVDAVVEHLRKKGMTDKQIADEMVEQDEGWTMYDDFIKEHSPKGWKRRQKMKGDS